MIKKTGNAPAAAVAAASIALMVSCAAPSRRIPVRIVDEPMTLPDGLIEAQLGGGVARTNIADEAWSRNLLLSFRYGITDRLELVDLLSLKYTFADDAPPPAGRGRQSFGLALRAGVTGLGYSSIEGWLAAPIASLEARKRLGDNVYIFAVVQPWVVWSSRDGARGALSLASGAVLQVTERSALSLRLGGSQGTACLSLSRCDPRSRSFGISPGWQMRFSHWFTAGFALHGGFRVPHGPPKPPPTPDAPAAEEPRNKASLGASLWTQFYW